MEGGLSYDRDTGQVFKEWVEKRLSLNDNDWHRRQPYPMSSGATGIGKHGARPLMDMCIMLVGNNIDDIDNETVRGLPDSLLWLVWDYLSVPSRGLSFHSWKLFVARLAKEQHPRRKDMPLQASKFHREFALPKAPLRCYIDPTISTSFDFLVHLTITGGASFGVNELLSLSDLVNLRTLEIVRPDEGPHVHLFPRVSDRIVREWSSRTNPFPALQSLQIFGDDLTTFESLQYVTKFPALTVYDVGGRLVDWGRDKAQHPAWKRGVRPWTVDDTPSEPLASITLGQRTRSTTLHSLQSIVWTFTRTKPWRTVPPGSAGEVTRGPQSISSGVSHDVVIDITGPSHSRASKRSVEADRLKRKKLKGVKDMLSDFGH